MTSSRSIAPCFPVVQRLTLHATFLAETYPKLPKCSLALSFYLKRGGGATDSIRDYIIAASLAAFDAEEDILFLNVE